jgi:hypothetical protein
MPWVGGEFRWTVEEKLGDLLQGDYGEEHERKLADLTELVGAVRNDLADDYRERVTEDAKGGGLADPRYQEILTGLADELDPK